MLGNCVEPQTDKAEVGTTKAIWLIIPRHVSHPQEVLKSTRRRNDLQKGLQLNFEWGTVVAVEKVPFLASTFLSQRMSGDDKIRQIPPKGVLDS